ncbi:hypothetical protein D3C76_1174180 [compost metagenome]
MIDLDQHLRGEVGAARHVGGKGMRIDQCLRAQGLRIGNLPADEIRRARTHQRAEGGGFVQRVAQHVLTGQFGEAIDKGRVDFPVDVDTLHGAAALPGIEETAVHQVLHRMLEVGIGPHVGRVLAAELKAHAQEILDRRALHFQAGRH